MKTRISNQRLSRKDGGEIATEKVRIAYLNPSAQTVYIAGAFNDWHPTVTDMLKAGEGQWIKELVLKPGKYEYRLVVDGQWITDPQCPESTPNPYGEMNSILIVPPTNGSRNLPART